MPKIFLNTKIPKDALAEVKKSLFISVEGGEGVGKTLFLKQLAASLRTLVSVHETKEPGGTLVADEIRQIFLKDRPLHAPILPMARLMLICAARHQHVEQVIKPTLAAGAWVLCDRFKDSTLVYQGAVGQISPDVIDQLNHLATGGLEPDLTFLLDCDVAISLARLQNRQREEQLTENDRQPRAFHEKVRQAFLDLANSHPSRIFVLDASQDPVQLAHVAIERIRGI